MNAFAFDTIVAPATPVARSALCLVRIDGPQARDIITELAGKELEPRRATLAHLRDADGLIDEAVCTFYVAPHSFTGNDLVEVTLHGSPYIVERLLRAVISRGGRIAEPGEFTERAVLNGRIDLLQAEAIGDLIESRTAAQARLSLNHLDGDLSRLAHDMRVKLLELISKLEGALDFAEEGYEFISRDAALARIEDASGTLELLASTYHRGRATARGVAAVILGRPNAGKSTLMNFLCGTERAIVTPIPGTTRDVLREMIEIGGLPVTIVDTAGLREAADVVEEIGVGRAREEATRADLILYLVDSSQGITSEDSTELATLRDPVVIWTKNDLADAPRGELSISIATRRGVDELLQRLDALIRERFATPEGMPSIVNERQKAAIDECTRALADAKASVVAEANEEIVLVDLYRAANALGMLTGEISTDDVLAEIFAKFCIGK